MLRSLISAPLRRFCVSVPSTVMCCSQSLAVRKCICFPISYFFGCTCLFLYFRFLGCVGGWGVYLTFVLMDHVHVWNQIPRKCILIPSKQHMKMLYYWRLNVFQFADKFSSGVLSKIGDYFFLLFLSVEESIVLNKKKKLCSFLATE